MNYTFDTHVGDGTTTAFTFGFAGPDEGYIELRRDLRVSVNAVEVAFTTSFADPNKVFINPAPVMGASILIRRVMPRETTYSDFKGGNAFTPANLNYTALQQLYLTQELLDGFYDADFYFKQTMNMGGHRIVNMSAGIDPMDAVNKGQLAAVDDKHTTWNEAQDEEIASLKQGLVDNVSLRTVPWLHRAAGGESEIAPPFKFVSAWVYRNGVMQYQLDGAFSVINNKVVFPAGSYLRQGELVLICMGAALAEPDDKPTLTEVVELVDDKIDELRTELASDSGASMIGMSHGTLSDAIGYVTPAMFGVYPERRDAGQMTEVSDKLQAMFDYAVANHMYVDTQMPGDATSVDSGWGYFINKPIVITGLAGLRGVLHIDVNGNTFVDNTGFNTAVVVANAGFNGTTIVGNTTRGNLNYDWIEVRNTVRRSGTVRGLLWIASRSTVKKVKCTGFSGRSIWCGHAYDSTIERLEVEYGGNRDDWAADLSFYTPSTGFQDETNGLTVVSMLIHNCTDRAWRCFGSKNSILNVHEEATYALNAPTTPSAQDVRTSLGYMNSFFSSTGGYLGNVSIMPDATSTQPHVFAVGAVGTTVSNIYTTGTTVCMPGDPAQRGGCISNMYTQDLYIIDQARTSIVHLDVTGALYGRAVRNDSTIMGGNITNVVENVGDIYNVHFRTPVTINPAFSHSYVRCTFAGGGIISTSTAMVTADTCIFNGAMTTLPSTKLDYINCLFGGNLTISGTLLDVIFKGGQISGNLTISAGVTGSWLFPDPPRITGSIVNWQWPTGTVVTGSRTRHPAPPNVVGDTVERVFNGTVWVVTQKVL